MGSHLIKHAHLPPAHVLPSSSKGLNRKSQGLYSQTISQTSHNLDLGEGALLIEKEVFLVSLALLMRLYLKKDCKKL